MWGCRQGDVGTARGDPGAGFPAPGTSYHLSFKAAEASAALSGVPTRLAELFLREEVDFVLGGGARDDATGEYLVNQFDEIAGAGCGEAAADAERSDSGIDYHDSGVVVAVEFTDDVGDRVAV